jgi:hypothetical protein
MGGKIKKKNVKGKILIFFLEKTLGLGGGGQASQAP